MKKVKKKLKTKCAVCKSCKNVEFLTITNCNLCGKCQDELAEAFQEVMIMRKDEEL